MHHGASASPHNGRIIIPVKPHTPWCIRIPPHNGFNAPNGNLMINPSPPPKQSSRR